LSQSFGARLLAHGAPTETSAVSRPTVPHIRGHEEDAGPAL